MKKLSPILLGFLVLLVSSNALPGSAQETENLSIFEDAYPSWSPDGSQIVFQSTRAGDENQIFLMNADGSGVTQLTFTEAGNLTPVFSPDGTKIAFQSERDGNREIYVMNADGANQTRLTDEETEDSHPKWSSDGKYIIFDSVRANPGRGMENIFVMNADGSGVERLTERQEVDSYSSLSPDGARVLFRRILATGGNSESGRNSEVFIMNRDGSNVRNLTNDPDFDGYPSWSPDGRYILFASNCGHEDFDEFNIFIMKQDGTGLRQLTQTLPKTLQARQMVSPDGHYIVFNRDYPDGRIEIHVMEFKPE
ncbi:MAG: PD40 domain-containing protein [Proteobacteria bacterium]|nr:PD40 domain-containing protein [Pseudomonadota bacterium]